MDINVTIQQLQYQVEQLLQQDKINQQLLDQLLQKHEHEKTDLIDKLNRNDPGTVTCNSLRNIGWNHVKLLAISLLIIININILCFFCITINSTTFVHTHPIILV